MSGTKIVIISIIILLILGTIGYWYYMSTIVEIENEPIQHQEEDKSVEFAPSHVPDGWRTYTSSASRWSTNDRDVAFAYPSSWNLEEKFLTTWFDSRKIEETRLESILLTGEGYRIEIHQKGRGMSSDWTTEEVGGYNARMWEFEADAADGLKYGTTLGIIDAGFIITAFTSDEEKQVFEEFISTIEFEVLP